MGVFSASAVSVPRGSGAGQSASQSNLAVYFAGQTTPSWSQWISIPLNAQPWDSFFLWISLDGYVFCDGTGVVLGNYWQRLATVASIGVEIARDEDGN